MQVLLLDLGNEWRGGQRQVLYLAQALVELGLARVWIGSPKGSPLVEKAHTHRLERLELPGPREWQAGNWLCLRRFLQRVAIDVLHTNDARSAALGALIRRACAPKTKLLHTRRVSYPVRRGARGWKYRQGDCLVGVSQEIVNQLTRSGVPARRLRTIPSAIDYQAYPVRDPQRPWPGRPLTLGCIGSLSPQKGHRVLIQALAEEGSSLPDWRLYVLGQGPLAARLQQQVQGSKLSPRVSFLGYQDSKEYLARLDVLIVPSVDGEGSSAVIKEGWASGVPVLASDLESNRELIRSGSNGVLFANKDPKGLISSLLGLVGDPDLAGRCVQGGAEAIVHFGPKGMARQYLDCYLDLTRGQTAWV